MNTYAKFKELNMNLSALGLRQEDTEVTYYCTPKGAKIIGWAGVDGIHYCTIHGFGELIFAVSPMNFGDCVHPIARSFEDLLRLLLSCVDMAALEQCYAWEEEQFNAFRVDCPATNEQQIALDSIRREFGLEPMENAFAYVKELQAEFDLSEIPYTEDYYDPEMNAYAPEEETEWQVFFDNGCRSKNGKGRAGEEITVNSRFSWGDEVWHIPAVYSCSKGLVVDFCVEIDSLKLKGFLDKWVPLLKDNERIPRDVQEQLDNENPLEVKFRPQLFLNGKEFIPKHGTSTSWIPESCLPDDVKNQREEKQHIKHYGLDETRAWSFHRWSCPWATQRKPTIQSLKLKLERRPATINGIHFKNPSVGDVIRFTHPISHTEYKLTVQEYEQQELSSKAFAHEEYEYPTHHTAMTYTLEPDLSNKNFQVRDCLENDEPKRRPKNPYEPQASYDACSIGIIGGADGPTAILFSQGAKTKTVQHAALSALHFEPASDVEWKIVFREKLMEDVEAILI